jgi:hypothetical protein
MMTTVLRSATKGKSEFYSKEKLEEARAEPAEELAKAKLSEKEVEQQLGDRIVELDSTSEWQLNATREEEDGKGDLVDLPICREEVQWSRLQKESQPWEQLDEIIEDIIRLMIRLEKVVNKGKLSRGIPAIAAGQQM